MSVTLAPAKINLSLHVGPAKANGRHPLDSLTVFAGPEAADRIKIDPADSLQFAVIGPFADKCGDLNDNLVFKAAYGLQSVLKGVGKAEHGARITLVKHLPVAAGIGGGSADAAATLKGLNALWNDGATPVQLLEIGRQLGGDVPACLYSRPVLMRGEGERIEQAALPAPLPALLVNSGTACPTGAVFQTFDISGGGADFQEMPVPEFRSNTELIDWLNTETANDLEAPALVRHPDIAQTLGTLRALPHQKLVRMSGSGATCFALFETMEAAAAAASAVRAEQPHWWCVATKLGGLM